MNIRWITGLIITEKDGLRKARERLIEQLEKENSQ